MHRSYLFYSCTVDYILNISKLHWWNLYFARFHGARQLSLKNVWPGLIKESRNLTTSSMSPQRPSPVGACIVLINNDDISIFRIYLVSLVLVIFSAVVFFVVEQLLFWWLVVYLFVRLKFSKSFFLPDWLFTILPFTGFGPCLAFSMKRLSNAEEIRLISYSMFI